MFLRLKQSFDLHRQRVETERRLYVANRKQAQLVSKSLVLNSEWATVDAEQHLSIDAMRQLAIPTFGTTDQPSHTYYHSVVNLTPMGVSDEGTGETRVFIYDQTAPKTCSDSVISCLDRFLDNHQYGCQRLLVNMDNCQVNKSYYVLSTSHVFTVIL